MKKLFTNDVFFAVTTWISVLTCIPYAIVIFMSYPGPLNQLGNIARILGSICLLVTYFAYKSHSKNVMKGMIGSILTSFLMLVACGALLYQSVFSWIAFGMILVLFISHFVINSDHHSSPSSVRFNQILSLIFAILMGVEAVLAIPECVNTFDTIAQTLQVIGQPCGLFAVVAIESRLDAYRKDREAAGWTEEKGYPEGYVHEFEKKKAKAK